MTLLLTESRPRVFNVLVVDDFGPVAELMANALERNGYHATFVESGTEALAAFDESPFDLVICDIVMPGMNGWELMAKLRERGPVRGIAVSALQAPEHRARSRAVGFALHLAKPLDLDRLLEAVDGVLKPSGMP